jgi:hypothetical protein
MVVVRIGTHQHASFSHLVAEVHPTMQLLGTVHHGLAPSHRLFFDGLAVAKPSDVGPVGGDRIELQFRRARHNGAILQDQSDRVIPKVCRLGIQPVSIANFYRELVGAW